MEFVIAIIAIILIYLLIRYVIIPIASVVGIITLVISGGYALVVSLISFIKGFIENLHPYDTYMDKHTNIPDGIRRNYCFGPGFHQIGNIIKDAFSNLSNYRHKLTDWKTRAIRHNWIIDIWIYLGYIFAIFCAQVLGFIWVVAFSIVLSSGIIIGMTFFFIFFSALWLLDRSVLFFKSIHNRCPKCKRKSVIPVFLCPTCGLPHKNLVPGPYGVTKRRCSCGTMLATTFLGGRSQYEAHCPFCDSELLSSSSKQYGIQLVGGVGTGKTTFLAAFWHEYREWLDKEKKCNYESMPKEAFDDLEDWFKTGKAEATIQTNANMYSIIHHVSKNNTVQMTIYDIAGEAFDFAGSDTQQQQFRYCEGFLLVIDPTAKAEYVSETITNFINSLDEFKGKSSSKSSSVPVAVIISKSDMYKKEIGLPKIKSSYNSLQTDNYTFEKHQDDICKSFLSGHGYANVTNLIEAEFSNVRYFPVSAMGHNIENGQYEPWGVTDPIFWLMSNENCPLRGMFI